MCRSAAYFALSLNLATQLLGQATQPASTQPAGRVRLVANIDVKDFGAETLRLGDLDMDGQIDLLLTQSIFFTREITCHTALRITGEIIWQVGTPSLDNGRIYSDLPVQVYDWDNDGRNEVVYLKQAKYLDPWDGRSPRQEGSRFEGDATMIILDGATGREKMRLPMPAAGDDSFLFADLTGRGRRQDFVVKDRYNKMWGVSAEGKVLWQYVGSTGHFPAVADVDEDGRDEVFVGYALVDHDGRVLFQIDPKGGHQDACWVLRGPDGMWRLLFGNTGFHCLSRGGRLLWEKKLGEGQHVVAGRFRGDSPVQLAVVDRTPVPRTNAETAYAILYLHDLEGREIWNRHQVPGDWPIAPLTVNWSGPNELESIFVYGQRKGTGRSPVIYNGLGEITDTFPMQYTSNRSPADRKEEFYGLVADVWGDCRDEILLFGSRGLCIYANTRPLLVPTLYNETLYPGM